MDKTRRVTVRPTIWVSLHGKCIMNQYDNIRNHMENIGLARRSAKLVVFWSFISLCYIFGDLQVVQETAGADSVTTLWGIRLSGITGEKAVILLFILTLYFFIRFLFDIIRISLLSSSYQALKDMIAIDFRGKGVHWQEIELSELAREEVLGEGQSDVTQSQVERLTPVERWRLMARYGAMGLILTLMELFFGPIAFPAVLGLSAIIMLIGEMSS